MNTLLKDILATFPVTVLTLTVLPVILIGAFKKQAEAPQFWITLTGLCCVIVPSLFLPSERGAAFSNMMMTGGLTNLFTVLFAASTLLTIIAARPHLQRIGTPYGEFYILVLLACIGMIVFASAADLIMTFIGLEILSICLYVLTGFTRKIIQSNEASLKYFLLGSFATGFFLYGIALIYGSTGTTNLLSISERIHGLQYNMLFHVGLALLLTGFAFKIGAAPFHMWVPDVYEGAPTMSTAYMSTGAKAAAFASLTMVFNSTLHSSHDQLTTAMAVIAVASMVIGNVTALVQNKIKRLLAYSSIGHAGYILIGSVAGTSDGIEAVVFYLVSYVFTNIGAFIVVSMLEDAEQGPVTFESMRGLAKKRPVLAALMCVFLFSLTGIPPLSGFFGKYAIFVSAIKQGYTWLAIVGIITSVISAYYYLRVVVTMYFEEGSSETRTYTSAGGYATLTTSAFVVVLFGLVPSILINWIHYLLNK
jgi:NADH-quinone oxidoreductase subunit N